MAFFDRLKKITTALSIAGALFAGSGCKKAEVKSPLTQVEDTRDRTIKTITPPLSIAKNSDLTPVTANSEKKLSTAKNEKPLNKPTVMQETRHHTTAVLNKTSKPVAKYFSPPPKAEVSIPVIRAYDGAIGLDEKGVIASLDEDQEGVLEIAVKPSKPKKNPPAIKPNKANAPTAEIKKDNSNEQTAIADKILEMDDDEEIILTDEDIIFDDSVEIDSDEAIKANADEEALANIKDNENNLLSNKIGNQGLTAEEVDDLFNDSTTGNFPDKAPPVIVPSIQEITAEEVDDLFDSSTTGQSDIAVETTVIVPGFIRNEPEPTSAQNGEMNNNYGLAELSALGLGLRGLLLRRRRQKELEEKEKEMEQVFIKIKEREMEIDNLKTAKHAEFRPARFETDAVQRKTSPGAKTAPIFPRKVSFAENRVIIGKPSVDELIAEMVQETKAQRRPTNTEIIATRIEAQKAQEVETEWLKFLAETQKEMPPAEPPEILQRYTQEREAEIDPSWSALSSARMKVEEVDQLIKASGGINSGVWDVLKVLDDKTPPELRVVSELELQAAEARDSLEKAKRKHDLNVMEMMLAKSEPSLALALALEQEKDKGSSQLLPEKKGGYNPASNDNPRKLSSIRISPEASLETA